MSRYWIFGKKKIRNLSEPLISLVKKESRMKEETKMTTTEDLSPSTIEYVVGAYKGRDRSLGEIVTLAQQYENEMNAWIDGLEVKEGLRR